MLDVLLIDTFSVVNYLDVFLIDKRKVDAFAKVDFFTWVNSFKS